MIIMQNKITLRGYSFQRETEYGGLLVVRRPDGSKVGTTQSEAAARILVRTDERRRARGN
jgi:hypothetical protein